MKIDYMVCWKNECEHLLFLGASKDIPNTPPPEKRVCDMLVTTVGSISDLHNCEHELPDECVFRNEHMGAASDN